MMGPMSARRRSLIESPAGARFLAGSSFLPAGAGLATATDAAATDADAGQLPLAPAARPSAPKPSVSTRQSAAYPFTIALSMSPRLAL